jgi:tRNA (guanine37-N1)-methyltransferase
MVMTVQPIDACITQLKSENLRRNYLYVARRRNFEKWKNVPMSMYENIIIFADIIKEWINAFAIISLKEISIGDYVLSEENWCFGIIGCFND